MEVGAQAPPKLAEDTQEVEFTPVEAPDLTPQLFAPPASFVPTAPNADEIQQGEPLLEEESVMTAEEALSAIERYAEGTWWRERGATQRIVVEDFSASNAYHLTLESFTEERHTVPDYRPYRGGHVDDSCHGQPPHPWSVDVRPSAYFVNNKVSLPLPHTEEVRRCYDCWGRGRKRCTWCNGMGSKTCTSCGGTGTVVDHMHHHSHSDHHNHHHHHHGHHHHHHHRVPCHHCHFGRVRCNWCHGSGKFFRFYFSECLCFNRKLTTALVFSFFFLFSLFYSFGFFFWGVPTGFIRCNTCEGEGQLVHFLRLDVVWKTKVDDRVLDYSAHRPELDMEGGPSSEASPLLDKKRGKGDITTKSDKPRFLNAKKIRKAGGVLVHHEMANLLPVTDYNTGLRVTVDVNNNVNAMLKEAIASVSGKFLHQQRLNVRGMPVYKMIYSDQGNRKVLWIYGTDRKVHMPSYPLSYKRISFFIVVLLLILALVGGGVGVGLFFAFR
ncbi:Zinc transporter [Balamuthia mandrillaris]